MNRRNTSYITVVLMACCTQRLRSALCLWNKNLMGRTYSDNLQTFLKDGIVVNTIRIDIEPMQNVGNGYMDGRMQSHSNAHKNIIRNTRNASVQDITQFSMMSRNVVLRIL